MKWMTNEIFELIKKQIMVRNGREYKILSKDIRNKYKQAKDE